MNWHITKSQDTGRRQIKQKKNKKTKKPNTENSKDEQQKNVGHHYTQTYTKNNKTRPIL